MSASGRACFGAGLGAAIALALGGCPKQPTPPPQPPPTPNTAPPPGDPPLGDDVFVRAEGHGATEDEAYAAASTELARALLGDPAWAQRAELAVHRRDTDPQRRQPSDEGLTITLGLSRAQAAIVLSNFENHTPTVEGPDPWLDPLRAYLTAHTAVQACARRAALFGSACEAPDTTEADTELFRLLEGVAIVPTVRDGVPVDEQGYPLRDFEVFVSWAGVPMAGVPLRLSGGEAMGLTAEKLRTDASGVARVELPRKVVATPLTISLDADALLGPHRDRVPTAQAPVEPRAVTTKRWGIAVQNRGEPNVARPRDRMRTEAVAQLSATLGGPVKLGAPNERTLTTAAGEARSEPAKALGTRLSGAIDRVLVLSYETRFASRMGGSRVWFEATGTLEALDVWTGRSLARVEASLEADGIGESRADDAARRQLAQALTKKLLAELQQ